MRRIIAVGAALLTAGDVAEALHQTGSFTADLFALARAAVERGHSLGECYREAMDALRPRYGHWVIFEHCMPFNVSRAFDEASGIAHPRIWTAERDLEMWRALEGASPMKSAEAH